MSRRVWIISSSIAVHTGVAVSLVAHGVWKVDQLDPGRADVSLAVPVAMPPPPAAGGAPANVQVPVSRPKHVAKDLTQQRPKLTLIKAAAMTGGGGTGTTGTGLGNGDTPGTCLVEPCGPPTAPIPEIPLPEPLPEVKIPPLPMLPQHKLEELRTSGETQLAPSYDTKREMDRAGKHRVVAVFKVCIDTTGTPAPSLIASSGFPAYDARLADGIRKWRYRPLTVNGVATPTCGPVRYEYTMR